MYRLKIIHWVLFLLVLTIILRLGLIINYLFLIINYLVLFFEDTKAAFSVVNFSLVDSFFSVIFILSLGPIIFLFRKRLTFLDSRLSFSYLFLVLLFFVFFFAPVISNENPEFSKSLSITKLLPPLSSVTQIKLKQQYEENSTRLEIFRRKMDSIIKPNFDDNIIFADSVHVLKSVIYYQKGIGNEISKEKLVKENNIPTIEQKTFILGTDEYGRDLFIRLMYGTRISITIGVAAVILSLSIGILLGFVAGYFGGLADTILNRFTEIFLAFPIIYLVILILALFGSSMLSVVIVLGVSGWMSLFKIVKSEVLSIKQKDFFSAAQLIGLNKLHLLLKEILPAIIAPILVNLVFLFCSVVLAEAALSYLGLGIGNSYPSWGSMISSGQEYINKAWWLLAFPGLALIFTLFTVNTSGRKLGKTFNPRLKD